MYVVCVRMGSMQAYMYVHTCITCVCVYVTFRVHDVYVSGYAIKSCHFRVYVCMHCIYLLGCTGWQELDSVSLVSQDATRQEDGVLLGIIGHEGDQALNLLYCESMFGSPLAVTIEPLSLIPKRESWPSHS